MKELIEALIHRFDANVEQAQSLGMHRASRDLPIRGTEDVAIFIGILDGAWTKPLSFPIGHFNSTEGLASSY